MNEKPNARRAPIGYEAVVPTTSIDGHYARRTYAWRPGCCWAIKAAARKQRLRTLVRVRSTERKQGRDRRTRDKVRKCAP